MVGRTNVIGGSKKTTKSVFTYTRSDTGTSYSFTDSSASSSVSGVYYFVKNGSNWEFYAFKSGSLTVPSNTELNVDMFLLGGGYSGSVGGVTISSAYYEYGGGTLYWCSACSGGYGGSGGYRNTITDIILTGEQTVTCGAAQQSSIIGPYNSNSGTQSGANANGGYCFGDSTAAGPDGNSRRVGAGGGKGATSTSNGTTVNTTPAQSGGNYGGGSGGSADASSNSAGKGSNGSYWGAGGGGGGAWGNTSQSNQSNKGGKGNGGTGYAGFVAIRNKR